MKSGSVGSYSVEVSSYLGNLTSSGTTVSLRAAPLVNGVQGGRFVIAGGASTTLEVDPALITSGGLAQALAADRYGLGGRPLPAEEALVSQWGDPPPQRFIEHVSA